MAYRDLQRRHNVGVPAEPSMRVIRHLESPRLYITAGRAEAEYDRLMNQAEAIFLQAPELRVDVTESASKVRSGGVGPARQSPGPESQR